MLLIAPTDRPTNLSTDYLFGCVGSINQSINQSINIEVACCHEWCTPSFSDCICVSWFVIAALLFLMCTADKQCTRKSEIVYLAFLHWNRHAAAFSLTYLPHDANNKESWRQTDHGPLPTVPYPNQFLRDRVVLPSSVFQLPSLHSTQLQKMAVLHTVCAWSVWMRVCA